MLRSYWLLPLVLLACQHLSGATVCVTGTFDTYQALGSTGCTVGGITVKDFVFTLVSSSGGATIANTDVTVIPTFPFGGRGLDFESPKFSVTGPQTLSFLMGYTWDPSGDMRNASDILDPGNVDILTDLCINGAFVGSVCTGLGTTTHTLHVFQGGGPSQLTDSFAFAPTGSVGIRNNVSLTSGGSFTGIENDVFVPEPATAAGAAAGLLMLAARWRRGRARKTR